MMSVKMSVYYKLTYIAHFHLIPAVYIYPSVCINDYEKVTEIVNSRKKMGLDSINISVFLSFLILGILVFLFDSQVMDTDFDTLSEAIDSSVT